MAASMLESVYNHVVIPLDPPTTADKDPPEIEKNICRRLLRACNVISREPHASASIATWQAIETTLKTYSTCIGEQLDRKILLSIFKNFGQDDYVVLPVLKQNAAIIIRDDSKSSTVVFEAFEVSAPPSMVLEPDAALLRDFPGCATSIPRSIFDDGSFQKGLALFLEDTSSETLHSFDATVVSQGHRLPEARETAHPGIITSGLMQLLEQLGGAVDVPEIRKRTRDTVVQGSEPVPWRRLPQWLLLRVAIHRQLQLLEGPIAGQMYYKLFMAVFLAELLQNCTQSRLTPSILHRFNAKLCRRLNKLTCACQESPEVCAGLFQSLTQFFLKIVEATKAYMEDAWNNQKMASIRNVPRLRLHADPGELTLSLACSAFHLKRIKYQQTVNSNHTRLNHDIELEGDHLKIESFFSRIFDLASQAKASTSKVLAVIGMQSSTENDCIELSDLIQSRFQYVGTTYHAHPQQESLFALEVMQLWVRMDSIAISLCPLLAAYHPSFTPDLLHVLQLPEVNDMARLAAVENYLRDRIDKHSMQNVDIFAPLGKNCFAVRYHAQDQKMKSLTRSIWLASDSAREAKKAEFTLKLKEYETLTERIDSLEDDCTFVDGIRDASNCKKCYLQRQRRKLSIKCHEDYLPDETVQASAIVFELLIPTYLAAYRHATRLIHSTWTQSSHRSKNTQMRTIRKQKHLQDFSKHISGTGNITLALKKKTFLQTHYEDQRLMQASEMSVLLPSRLDVDYYDDVSFQWLMDIREPVSLQSRCGVIIPRILDPVFSKYRPPGDFYAYRPSSYDIVANSSRCPPELASHEFAAYQRILSGSTRRWLQVLVELESTNLNFSLESVSAVVRQISIQVGPAHLSTDLWRDSHWVFGDSAFCQRLHDCLLKRLVAIESNWREMHQMELLIDLSLRMSTLTDGSRRILAVELLGRGRNCTLAWTQELRQAMRLAEDEDTARQMSMYALRAALLCRRTFRPLAENAVGCAKQISTTPPNVRPLDMSLTFERESLRVFIQASISMHQNLVAFREHHSKTARSHLISDITLAFRLQSQVSTALSEHKSVLNEVIAGHMTGAHEDGLVTFADWSSTSKARWLQSTMTVELGQFRYQQRISVNTLEGQLLVNGKPLGELPQSIRESACVKTLFHNQRLQCWISHLPGMSYRLAEQIDGYEVHLGVRSGNVVACMVSNREHLEHIPREIFRNHIETDLPAKLLDNCVHWLNLRNDTIEIRSEASIWKTRPDDWIVDLSRRTAKLKEWVLVDTSAAFALDVYKCFEHFVERQRIFIYQSQNKMKAPRIELPDFDLSFFVNDAGLLQCKELAAEIDPNQDAGTWYGFKSMIVLRENNNHARRSIIAPLGEPVYHKDGFHVALYTRSTTNFGRFEIDKLLGRISCSVEPRALFSKALFHAFTSFVIPDPLTLRTGAEEAMSILRSGRCQPWTGLSDGVIHVLRFLTQLMPKRGYYPAGSKMLQTIQWNEHLPVAMQYDMYGTVLSQILQRSRDLQQFSAKPPTEELLNSVLIDSNHLMGRATWDRALYERGLHLHSRFDSKADSLYLARDRDAMRPRMRRSHTRSKHRHCATESLIKHVVQLLHRSLRKVKSIPRVKEMLEQMSMIGGFPGRRSAIATAKTLVENPVNEQFGNLVDICRGHFAGRLNELMFRLTLLCFNANMTEDLMTVLCICAVDQNLQQIDLPKVNSFQRWQYREVPQPEVLKSLLSGDYDILNSATTVIDEEGDQDDIDVSALMDQRAALQEECDDLAEFFLKQWPSDGLTTAGFQAQHLSLSISLETALQEWRRIHHSRCLSGFVDLAQAAMSNYSVCVGVEPLPACPEPGTSKICLGRPVLIPTLDDLIMEDCSHEHIASCRPVALDIKQPIVTAMTPAVHCSREASELQALLHKFLSTNDPAKVTYGQDLCLSLAALNSAKSTMGAKNNSTSGDPSSHKVELQEHLHEVLQRLHEDFAATNAGSIWLQQGGLWPCMSLVSLLEELQTCREFDFGRNTKQTIIKVGLLITQLQRLDRIAAAQSKHDGEKVQQELKNIGHENWNPLDCPDWLLLEIDANLLIRPKQVQVALEMIEPSSGSNSVIQLNMGEGKSSVITPMVACVLGRCPAESANESTLLRLIVPKALQLSTAQTLQANLGGLVGRSVMQLPFSRRTETTEPKLNLFYDLHQQTMKLWGVVIATPEHVMSFYLGGLQHLADSRMALARRMISIHDWLTHRCRDIIDECDQILGPKTQLIYPSGSLSLVDGHSFRWTLVQELVSLLMFHLPQLRRRFPRSIDVLHSGKACPIVHILNNDVQDAMLELLIDDVCQGRLTLLQFRNVVEPQLQEQLKTILMAPEVDAKALRKLRHIFGDKQSAYEKLLLVRGLLIDGILFTCLKKRWNVKYGLHPQRDPIAVPFEAKGVPSDQAEYGHPDVAIVCTCLAFYYTGLTSDQFRRSLAQVLISDNPAHEFNQWIESSPEIPSALRRWTAVNMDDNSQVGKLWNHLRFNRHTINHFLNHHVFPAHAKQFSLKMQTSAWDLPLTTNVRTTGARTTGFSGTNDTKSLLPRNIVQQDLQILQQTNAEVLTCLLEPRNRSYISASRGGRRYSENGLLRELSHHNIRILIDAGAYILEMDNRTLVEAWLTIEESATAAVYFDTNHRAQLLHKGTKTCQPLSATLYKDNLVDCLVYLDEAHTRGVDLRLPVKARGALTLALGQTKDHTVQAAMRLRQLATTQSLTFFGPPEVDQSIRDICKLSAQMVIDSSHVVYWLLEQTCHSHEQLRSLLSSQGFDFIRRMDARTKAPKLLDDFRQQENFLQAVRRPEKQSIEDLYGRRHKAETVAAASVRSETLRSHILDLRASQPGRNAPDSQVSVLEEVEQERQVEYQVEEERQIDKPVHYRGREYPGLHPAIANFVQTGKLIKMGIDDAWENAFAALSRTEVGYKHGLIAGTTQLLVSTEFMRTVNSRSAPMDNYLNTADDIALVVIPEEAEDIINMILRQTDVKTYLIPYAAPVTKDMLQFGRLEYYSLPTMPIDVRAPHWLRIELGILAGRLYLDYEECETLATYLNFAGGRMRIPQHSRSRHESFAKDSIGFLLEWLPMRRQGNDCTHTPVTYICQGRQLQPGDHFFPHSDGDAACANSSVASTPQLVIDDRETVEPTSADEDLGLLDAVPTKDVKIEDED